MSYLPHPAQKSLHTSRARFRTLCAGRRAGKSVSMGHEFIASLYRDLKQPDLQQRSGPPLQYWCVAPTAGLTSIQLREVRTACQDYGLPFEFNRGELTGTIPGWPVQIRYRSSHAINQLVGEDVWGLWWDEVAKSKADAWGYLEPCLTATAGWVLTSSTPEGQNWWWQEFWLKGDPTAEQYDPRYQNFHFRSADNPFLAAICPTCRASYRAGSRGWTSGFCSRDRVRLVNEAEWKAQALPARLYRREYLASFEAFMGQIYEELNQTLHWQELPTDLKFRRMVGAQDWNYALPGVYGLLAEDRQSNWWLLAEIHQARLPVWDDKGDCWVTRIKALNDVWEKRLQVRCEVIYADPAMPEHIDTERRQGLPVRAANNEVSAGIETVSVLSHPVPGSGPRLRFLAEKKGSVKLPLAKETWRQLLSYRFKPGTEQPLKEDDHGCDMLRYGLHSAAKTTRTGMHAGRLV